MCIRLFRTATFSSSSASKGGAHRYGDLWSDRFGLRKPRRAQNCDPQGPLPLTALNSFSLLTVQQQGVQVNVSLFAVGNCCTCPTALLIADTIFASGNSCWSCTDANKPRPRLEDADRLFWVLACRWFVGWRTSVLIVKPETVLRWHRLGWRRYWRRRSSREGKPRASSTLP